MDRQDLRDRMPVTVNWPNDDPEEAIVFANKGGSGCALKPQRVTFFGNVERLAMNHSPE